VGLRADVAVDVAIIGAGAAGMMAASVAGRRGLRVVLIDHARRLGEKIRISGGGRCNFTNLGTSPAQFLSRNPHFCRSALSAYSPRDFLDLLACHGVAWHEKHRGQLFCNDSSEAVITMLRRECDRGGVQWRMPCSVESIAQAADGFELATTQGGVRAARVVLATGGMAIPQLGATDYALKVARQFGLRVIEPRPALVPLRFEAAAWTGFASLSGVSLEAGIGVGVPQRAHFLEDVLITHRGLSGPGILQISSYWEPGEDVVLDLAPGRDLAHYLLQAKRQGRQRLLGALAEILPRRLAQHWLAQEGRGAELAQTALAELPDKTLRALAAGLQAWSCRPVGTAGWRKAEVMRGGVDTREIDQKTMQVRRVPGLYIVGEALDVTGWLGGYNFQWAWASGVACGRALAPG